MSIQLGGQGLAVDSGGGGASFTNPYEAIPGLNSLWAADYPNKVQWIAGGVYAINSASAEVTLQYMSQITAIEPWAPTIADLNAGHKGFQFVAASTQFLMQPSAAPDIVDDNGAFTLFGVVKFTIGAANTVIYGKGVAPSGGRRWSFGQSSTGDGTLQFEIAGTLAGNPDVQQISSDVALNDGNTHRIICIYNPANSPDPTITMYVDGALQIDQKVVVGPLQATSDKVQIASSAIGSYFSGLLGDLGSYDRAHVDPAQIAKLDGIMAKRFGM